jgi:hypothetical protein
MRHGPNIKNWLPRTDEFGKAASSLLPVRMKNFHCFTDDSSQRVKNDEASAIGQEFAQGRCRR